MTSLRNDIESFIERLPIGVVVLDNDLRMVNCNDLALDLLKVDIESCITTDFAGALADTPLKEMLLLMREGKGRQQSHLVVESGGRTIACTIKAVPGDEGAREFILTVEDSTKLRDLERMKREFIESLLHRIRGPLATLKTSLAIVQDDRMGALPRAIRDILGMGSHEVNRLSVLLDDMRDLFLIETGLAGKDLVGETFPVSDALNRANAGLLKAIPTFKTLQPRLALSGDLEKKVTADFDKTMRVFGIILKNAYQYSPDACPIDVQCIEMEDSANIRIKDNGEGIAKECLPQIFTKFYREDTPWTRRTEGNGLGLFIAKAYAELMGGSLYVESEPGNGATFILSLPLAKRT